MQIAALGRNFLKNRGIDIIAGLHVRPATSVFPALTCPAQALIRTALTPAQNGMCFNGFYEHDLQRPFFWEQSCKLVKGKRIWHRARKAGASTAMLFWQQSLGEDVDFLLSPAPVHTHGGGMIDAVYSKPEALYPEICASAKNKFKLHTYWGPLAGIRSSKFIKDATCELMSRNKAPDIIFSYLPHLDYSLQKFGPDHEKPQKALGQTINLIEGTAACARANGYEFLAYGDYAIGSARKVLFPNKALLRHGLFSTRKVRNRLYPDYCCSDAFAVTDHEVALVYLNNRKATERCRKAIESIDAEITVMDRQAMKERGLAYDGGPDFIITGSPGTWFAYPWWDREGEAPDFANHVDIHNKPGFDPCELFFGWHPFVISTDTSKIKGTHGHNSSGREIAWFSTLEIDAETLMDIALQLKKIMDGAAR